MGVLYEIRSASYRYAQSMALDDVSLSFREGECVALVGPSGSGKTTLLRLLNASLFPTSGQVLIEGREPSKLPFRELRQLRSRIGFVHQSLDLVSVLRVVQNVLLGKVAVQSTLGTLRSMVWPRRVELEAAYGVLKQVGIESKLFERTDRLSGGEQQRVAIARALYQKARVILADEPISSVDPARGQAVVDMMIGLAKSNQTTCIVGLHHFGLAKAMFPRIVALRSGKVLFDLPSGDVTSDHERELYAIPDAVGNSL